jgi:site-specific DNA-cytosine methylase
MGKQEQAGGSIDRKEGTSGASGRACIDYIFSARPAVFIIENVTNLARIKDANGVTDLEHLKHLFTELGYLTHHTTVQAEVHGSAQPRERIYLFAVLECLDTETRKPLTRVDAELFGDALHSLRQPPRAVSEFLLPDDHPEVLRYREERSRPDAKDNDKKVGFEVLHLEKFREVGLTWPPVDAEHVGRLDAVSHLSARQRDTALWHMHVAEKHGRTTEKIIDLAPSLDFGANSNLERDCMCVVSSVRPFALLRKRELCGWETLALQGLPFSLLEDKIATTMLGAIPHTKLHDLAGNAFSAFAIAPATSDIEPHQLAKCNDAHDTTVRPSMHPVPRYAPFRLFGRGCTRYYTSCHGANSLARPSKHPAISPRLASTLSPCVRACTFSSVTPPMHTRLQHLNGVPSSTSIAVELSGTAHVVVLRLVGCNRS